MYQNLINTKVVLLIDRSGCRISETFSNHNALKKAAITRQRPFTLKKATTLFLIYLINFNETLLPLFSNLMMYIPFDVAFSISISFVFAFPS